MSSWCDLSHSKKYPKWNPMNFQILEDPHEITISLLPTCPRLLSDPPVLSCWEPWGTYPPAFSALQFHQGNGKIIIRHHSMFLCLVAYLGYNPSHKWIKYPSYSPLYKWIYKWLSPTYPTHNQELFIYLGWDEDSAEQKWILNDFPIMSNVSVINSCNDTFGHDGGNIYIYIYIHTYIYIMFNEYWWNLSNTYIL